MRANSRLTVRASMRKDARRDRRIHFAPQARAELAARRGGGRYDHRRRTADRTEWRDDAVPAARVVDLRTRDDCLVSEHRPGPPLRASRAARAAVARSVCRATAALL